MDYKEGLMEQNKTEDTGYNMAPLKGQENTEIEEKDSGWEEGDDSLYVKFDRPFLFEGEETIRGIDLSGLENLNTMDLVEVEKKYYRQGVASVNPEFTVAYAKFIAQRATGMPVELFDQLPGKEMMKVKKTVVNFFFS